MYVHHYPVMCINCMLFIALFSTCVANKDFKRTMCDTSDLFCKTKGMKKTRIILQYVKFKRWVCSWCISQKYIQLALDGMLMYREVALFWKHKIIRTISLNIGKRRVIRWRSWWRNREYSMQNLQKFLQM